MTDSRSHRPCIPGTVVSDHLVLPLGQLNKKAKRTNNQKSDTDTFGYNMIFIEDIGLIISHTNQKYFGKN